MADFALRSRRTVLPSGVRDAAVVVRGGKIQEIVDGAAAPRALDLGERALLPGLVDTHAHINEPGRTDWEGFETATRAAAAGGITTVVDMPLNSIPPTTTLAGLEAKKRHAEGRCSIDYGFWGGVIPGNGFELRPMARAGTLGFKAFLIDSGVEEFPMVREGQLREAMAELASMGLPLLAHAELEGPAPEPRASRRYRDYLASRPRAWENEAVKLLIRLCKETGCRTHIVHLSSSEALADVARARKAGLPLTAETCPHYLALEAESIADGATQFKCAPPIRERENRERLWEALREGVIDFVVSDHSPCVPQLKRLEAGDFSQAWGGIAGLQFSLPVVWSEMSKRGFSLADLARLMSEAPARFAGLSAKGALVPGKDADLVIFNPDAEFTLKPAMVRHRHSLTPYAGMSLRGAVEAVYLRGEKIYEENDFVAPNRGRQVAQQESMA